MEIKNIDKILLIISIAIFIVILIFKVFPIKSSNNYVSSEDIKGKIERDVNLEIENITNTTNTLDLENNERLDKGPYPPFVEFIE